MRKTGNLRNRGRASLAVTILCLGLLLWVGCARTVAQEAPDVVKVEVALDDLVREGGEDVEFRVPEPSTPSPAPPASPAPKSGEPPVVESVPPVHGQTLALNDPQQVAQAEKPKSDEEIPKRDYKALLKDPQELGFSPGRGLFRNVFYHIKRSYVEPVSDQELFDGVKAEVKNLLEQAGVDPSPLERLNSGNHVLPQLLDMFEGKVDRDLLVFSAILGMLDGLHDNYSLLMTPKDYAKLQEQMQATNFGGIGIYIELDRDNGNRLTVFEPIEGTPAYESGLLAGDQIMAINGESTDGITLDAAQAQIRGEKGSQVVLTIKRKGESAQFKKSITRGEIHVVSASSKMMDGQIGYIRLRMFGSQTGQELEESLAKLRQQGAKGVILDLRNNGGGYIDASVNVVGQFLKEEDGLVVYTIDRNKRRRDYRSNVSGGLDVPVVVLINKFSASASEITAGALRDHGVASLVGEKSFGKGSVQQLYPFAEKAALKLTIAKFYTPKGTVINKKGLEPDFKVEMEPQFVGRGEKDVQLKKALSVVKQMRGTAQSL